MKRPTPGLSGWLAVAAVVLAAEVLDEKTMSKFWYETSRDPMLGPVMAAGYVYLGTHLFGLLPEKYDAFKHVGRAYRRASKREH